MTFHVAPPEPAPRNDRAPRPCRVRSQEGSDGDGSHGTHASTAARATACRHDRRRRHRIHADQRPQAGCAAASTSPHDAKGTILMSLASVAAQQTNAATNSPRVSRPATRR